MRDEYSTAATDSFVDADVSGQSQEASMPAVLLRLLRGRWHWAILLGVLLAAGGIYLGYHFEGPEFEAKSEITINPNFRVPVNVEDITLYEPYWVMVRAEIDRLEDLDTAELAMQQADWQEAVSRVGEGFTSMTPEGFIESLVFQPPYKEQRTLKVSFVSEEPLIAQAGLNALLDAYRLLQKQGTNENIDFSLSLLKDQLSDLELRQRQIKEQMRLVIPESEYLTIKRQLTAKLGMLASMELKLSDLELLLGPFLNPDGDSEVTLQDLMKQDPDMVLLLEQKEELEEEYIYQTEVLKRGEDMRNVQLINRMIARVERQILELEEKWMAYGEDSDLPLPDQIQDMLGRHKALSGKIAELEAEVNDISTRLSAVAEDEFELEQTIAAMREVQDEIEDFERTDELINTEERVTRIVIGDKFPGPGLPANAKKRVQLASMGGVAGLGVGFGFVMLIGLMDRRLRHVSDTVNDLPDTNVLGILPTLPADLSDPEQADAAAHCVHHIRTLLQIGGTNRVFSITSPTAGAGKSSLVTALGMSFAASGARTLVIDCDLVGAGLSRRMGVIVHESLEKVIRRNNLMQEADLASAMTKATSQGKPLEEVLIEENLISQDQLDIAMRLQRDTSLGLLDACRSGNLRPPVTRSAPRSNDLYVFLDDMAEPDGGDLPAYQPEESSISLAAGADLGHLRECVGETGIENLSILTVGKARPSDASRVSPAAVRDLIRQAREAYDIVLVDTGPVLGSIEASIAAAESDTTVMIVSRGDQRSVAARSLAQLRSVRAEVAGLVFNHALESDFNHSSYASVISQERRPDMAARKRKLDKTRSARLGPLGTAVASCTDDPSDESLMVTPNGNSH